MIEELLRYTPADLQDLDRLMGELSAASYCDREILDRLMDDAASHLYVMRDGNHIIACACLCVAHSPEFTLGFVESVTVLSTQRGKSYGRMLMEHLIAEARRLRVDRLHLTSNPKRVAANVLYQKLGFVRYDTNCYQLEFL